jgi:hypothetical protein
MKDSRFMQVRRMYLKVSPAHVLAKPISQSGACTLTPGSMGVRRMYSPLRFRTLSGKIDFEDGAMA